MPCCARFDAVLGTKIFCRASALLTQAQPKEPEGCEPLGVFFFGSEGFQALHFSILIIVFSSMKKERGGKGFAAEAHPALLSAFSAPSVCHDCSLFLLL